MIEVWHLILVFVAGIVLGLVFFGGLWFTVRKSLNTRVPSLWLMGGFIIRVTITLSGFYYISMGSFNMILICLLGFIVGRLLVFWQTKKYEQK
jgi:F1F0 ATPase subunit 2